MRITHVNLTSWNSGVDGIASAITALSTYQKQFGLDVTVLDAQSGGSTPDADWDRVRSSRPEVVHLHSAFRPRHVRLARRLREARIPYVVSPHSAYAQPALKRQRVRKAMWIALFDRSLLTSAQAVICLTPGEAAEVRRVAPRSTPVVVPNPLPPGIMDEIALRSPRRVPPHVVTLARFDVYQKGLDRLSEIASHLPEVRFSVYGETDRNSPGRAAKVIAAAPANLTFHPPVHGAAKTEVYAKATMFIQPSRWEGMSVSLLEALAHGVPTAVSSYVSASLGHRDFALELPDEPSIAALRLNEALHEPDALAERGARGSAWVRATTDPGVVIPLLLAAYHGDQPSLSPSESRGGGSA